MNYDPSRYTQMIEQMSRDYEAERQQILDRDAARIRPWQELGTAIFIGAVGYLATIFLFSM